MDSSLFEVATWGAIAGAYLSVLLLLFRVILIASWKLFTKAGQPGWAVLIPLYNLYVFTLVLRRPKWWALLYFFSFVPFVGSLAALFVSTIDSIRLANVFRKPPIPGMGILLLGFLFVPILVLWEAQYNGLDVDKSELI